MEALIFASEEGITVADLKPILEEALAIQISKDELEGFIVKIQEKYQDEDYVFELKCLNNAFQFLTKSPIMRVYNNYKNIRIKRN